MSEYGRIHTDGSRSGGQPVLKRGNPDVTYARFVWHSAPECWVECSCGAIGPQGEDTSTDDHIALWNTRQPTQSDALQADIDAMESILWVDTIIDDQEAIAKVFARHRQYGYDQGYYDGQRDRPPTQSDAEIIAENKRLRAALRTVEQGVPRPVGKSWFPDERPSKHDQCVHGIWMYEPCEGCTDAFIAEALGETK